MSVVAKAKRLGMITINQYDQHPSALSYRKAVYRAVKKGLLRRVSGCKPNNVQYVPVEGANEQVTTTPR